jgi:hypothetical protein
MYRAIDDRGAADYVGKAGGENDAKKAPCDKRAMRQMALH